jgi:hypothetical protein
MSLVFDCLKLVCICLAGLLFCICLKIETHVIRLVYQSSNCIKRRIRGDRRDVLLCSLVQIDRGALKRDLLLGHQNFQ